MADKDYSMVLLEQLVDQNKAILEYVGEMPKISARLQHVEQAVDELQADVKTIKSAVKNVSGELAKLDTRVSTEAARHLASLRKRHYNPFKEDRELASKAGRLGSANRWKGHVNKAKKADTTGEAQE